MKFKWTVPRFYLCCFKKKLHAHASVHQFQAFVLNLNDSILLYLSCANSEPPPPHGVGEGSGPPRSANAWGKWGLKTYYCLTDI